MPGRKIHDEADAHHCLQSLEDSGLSLVEWAREHGIDGRSLRLRGINLQRREPAPDAPAPVRLIELVPDRTHDASVTPGAGTRYVVRIADVEIEVGDDFRQDTLARLLEVVTC